MQHIRRVLRLATMAVIVSAILTLASAVPAYTAEFNGPGEIELAKVFLEW